MLGQKASMKSARLSSAPRRRKTSLSIRPGCQSANVGSMLALLAGGLAWAPAEDPQCITRTLRSEAPPASRHTAADVFNAGSYYIGERSAPPAAFFRARSGRGMLFWQAYGRNRGFELRHIARPLLRHRRRPEPWSHHGSRKSKRPSREIRGPACALFTLMQRSWRRTFSGSNPGGVSPDRDLSRGFYAMEQLQTEIRAVPSHRRTRRTH